MRYDVIIVGGGLVGAGLAVALRGSGLQIALIDAKLPTQDDPRLFALNHTSCVFLQNLQIWDKIAAHASAIHDVHVSRQGKFGSVRLQGDELQLSELGHVVPACKIEAALNETLSSLPDCRIYRPAQLRSLEQGDAQITLHINTEDGEKILHTALLIGADGTESTVRKQLNIAVDTFDYAQSAVVTRTTLQRSHQHIAYERFVKQGAVAMLPLTNNECATIWSGDHEVIDELMQLSDAAFLERLQAAMGYRLGKLKAIAKRHRFPLRMVKAQKAFAPHVLLLGNAAHTFHPIAAQGFNLALYEVAVLAEALQQQTALTLVDLERISAQTQKQQAVSMGVSHRLSRLFANESLLRNSLISAGMVGLDMALPVKNRFVSRLLGRSGRVPRLLMPDE